MFDELKLWFEERSDSAQLEVRECSDGLFLRSRVRKGTFTFTAFVLIGWTWFAWRKGGWTFLAFGLVGLGYTIRDYCAKVEVTALLTDKGIELPGISAEATSRFDMCSGGMWFGLSTVAGQAEMKRIHPRDCGSSAEG